MLLTTHCFQLRFTHIRSLDNLNCLTRHHPPMVAGFTFTSYTLLMEQVTLEHANTFFFITTIAVVILIIILLALLYVVYRASLFVKHILTRVETLIDKAGDSAEEDSTAKKVIPYVLPILGFFFNKKKSSTKKKV